MAIEATIVTKVDNTQAVNAQVGLRKEIRLLRDELEKLDEGTEEYQRTFNRLSTAMKTQQHRQMALRTSSGDLGDIIGNTTKTIAGLAGGFQAAQGAMILFGVESEDLQKALVKVQAAMSFTQGIAQMEKLTKSIPALINNVKGYFGQIGETSQSVQAGSKVVGDSVVGLSTKTASANNAVAGSTNLLSSSTITLSQAIDSETNLVKANLIAKKSLLETELDLIKANIKNNNFYAENSTNTEEVDKLTESLKNLGRQKTKTEGDLNQVNEKLKVYDEKTTEATESTEKLADSVNKTSSGFKGFAINTLKTLGVMALISAAITGIIYLYNNWDKIFSSIDKNQKLVNDTMLKGSQEAANQTLKLKLLREEFNKLDTIKEKTKFLNDYKDELKNVGIEVNSVTELEAIFSSNTNTQKYVNALEEKAKAQAAFAEMVTLSGEIQKLEFEKEELRMKKSVGAFESAWIRIKGIFRGDFGINEKEMIPMAIANIDEEIRKAQLKIEALKSSIDVSEILNKNNTPEVKKPKVEEEWIGSASKAKEVFEELPSIWDIIEQKRVESSREATQQILDYYDAMFEGDQINKANEFNKLLIQQYEKIAKKNFWYYWFTPSDDLENQIARSNKIIQDAQSNIAFRIDENTMLLQQLKNLDLTAEKRAEIEAKITENERINVEDRLRIAEEEFIKKRAINENLMAIAEESFNATALSFQAVIDNNDAAFEENRANLEAQYEQGKITKDKYDKQLLKAQQDQNEKNKKWQAGIAMIDGLVGAGKALSGAMELGPIAGPIIGGIQAAAIIASTAATIKKIYAQRVSDSGASSSNASVSSTATSAINAPLNYSANVLTQSQEAQLNKPTKVYVVSSEITDAQKRDKVTIEESTF